MLKKNLIKYRGFKRCIIIFVSSTFSSVGMNGRWW